MFIKLSILSYIVLFFCHIWIFSFIYFILFIFPFFHYVLLLNTENGSTKYKINSLYTLSSCFTSHSSCGSLNNHRRFDFGGSLRLAGGRGGKSRARIDFRAPTHSSPFATGWKRGYPSLLGRGVVLVQPLRRSWDLAPPVGQSSSLADVSRTCFRVDRQLVRPVARTPGGW